MQHSPAVAALIDALRALPGVGPKSAQRLAFHLLQQGRPTAQALAGALQRGVERVGRCSRCRMLTESELCEICASPQRDGRTLCVVESPADVVAIELSGGYRGRYFVLMGHLSPLDGIGPEQLTIDHLIDRVRQGTVREVILATNPTLEGDTTALYIHRLLGPRGVKITRLASGLPVGGDLEYADRLTIARALKARAGME